MTRAERETLALKRRQEEVEAKQKVLKEQEEIRKKFFFAAKKGIFLNGNIALKFSRIN